MSPTTSLPLTRVDRDRRLADIDWWISACEAKGDEVTARSWRRYRKSVEETEVVDDDD